MVAIFPAEMVRRLREMWTDTKRENDRHAELLAAQSRLQLLQLDVAVRLAATYCARAAGVQSVALPSPLWAAWL